MIRNLFIGALLLTFVACGSERTPAEDQAVEDFVEEIVRSTSGVEEPDASGAESVVDSTFVVVRSDAEEGPVGVNRRGTFQVPGEDIPFCVQATPGAKVEVRTVGGEFQEGVFNLQGDSLARPALEVDGSGHLYFNLSRSTEGRVFPQIYIDGRRLSQGGTVSNVIFTERADEVNAPYPAANTPFPEGVCLEPAE